MRKVTPLCSSQYQDFQSVAVPVSKMKTLYQLAFDAVPNKGLMAETFLVPWHPVAQQLQQQQYLEDRNRFREEHRVNFRFVYADLCFIETLLSSSKIYPSDVAFLNRLWKQIDNLL